MISIKWAMPPFRKIRKGVTRLLALKQISSIQIISSNIGTFSDTRSRVMLRPKHVTETLAKLHCEMRIILSQPTFPMAEV